MRVRSVFVSMLIVLAGCGDPTVVPPGDDAGVDPCVVDPTQPSCRPDPCDPDPCTGEHQRCVAREDAARCECEPGTHDEGGACVIDTTCMDGTCSGHGTCSDAGGTIACACEPGYTGDRCDACADGFFPDGAGGCDADPCDPSPCTTPSRPRCEVQDGAAVCLCAAGTHDEGGACVPDTTCLPDSCAGHGTCSESPEGIGCACEPGWAPPFCVACDAATGWHADGAGGCTMDPCTPNPCTAALETVCVAEPAGTRCECDAGAHREGGACVPDEVCGDATCSRHGVCSVIDGRTRCACEEGWDGTTCGACAAGWHDDGAGGCTTDPCLPDPCTTVAHRTVCMAAGALATCACEAGWHDDGVGGCTTDPCTPDPCAALGQACRVSGGAAECYTPVCDDGNPCTADAFSGGTCSSTPLANGTACSTTICTTAQTCTAGVCGGGTAISCDDGNPCTRDACDAFTGCSHANDATLVPDDGIACTVDACSASGLASHAASDAACDDAQWCTGTERCRPALAGADARGCVRESVPAPPGPSFPCRAYGACDEATDSFPVIARPAGTPCDDGLSCTGADVCVTAGGACAGTPIDGCTSGGAGTCASTVPWSSAIDVPSAIVQGTVTLAGGALPTSLTSQYTDDVILWAIARDTGARHVLEELRYTYSGGVYVLVGGGGAIDAHLVPGIYDVVYERGGSSGNWISHTSSGSPYPNGQRVLRTGVVLGPGTNTLSLDIPSARVSGSITLDGGAPPASLTSQYTDDVTIWAIARDTGARHVLEELRYTYSGGVYVLVGGGGTIDAHLVPGTYDIVFERGDASGDWISLTGSGSPYPNGRRVLRTGVVIGPGTSSLALDIPSARVSGSVTLDGGALPASLTSQYTDDVTIWAVARDTGARHVLEELRYTYSGGVYVLVTGGGTIDAHLVPGTYDVVYERGDASGDWISLTGSGSPYPNGQRVLRSGVVIGPGTSSLALDVPSSAVSGSVTLDGGALPASLTSQYTDDVSIWAVARDTGMRHLLESLRYTYSGGVYVLVGGGGTIDARLVPGTYDIVYERGSASGDWIARTGAGSPYPNGERVLRAGVEIGPGPVTLALDIPRTSVSGTVTIGGAAPPASLTSQYTDDVTIWAIAQDTGVRHLLEELRYTYSGGVYVLVGGGGTIDARLVPGTYDIVYARGDSTGDWIAHTSSGSPYPNGARVLREDVVIGPGSATLALDVPRSAVRGTVTVVGRVPPASLTSEHTDDVLLWAVARDTGVRHLLEELRYTYSGGVYVLVSGGGDVDARLVPGTYDILYERGGSSGDWVSRTGSGSPYPNGERYLAACVAIP